jgi:hypothetical protein
VALQVRRYVQGLQAGGLAAGARLLGVIHGCEACGGSAGVGPLTCDMAMARWACGDGALGGSRVFYQHRAAIVARVRVRGAADSQMMIRWDFRAHAHPSAMHGNLGFASYCTYLRPSWS